MAKGLCISEPGPVANNKGIKPKAAIIPLNAISLPMRAISLAGILKPVIKNWALQKLMPAIYIWRITKVTAVFKNKPTIKNRGY